MAASIEEKMTSSNAYSFLIPWQILIKFAANCFDKLTHRVGGIKNVNTIDERR